MEKKERKARAGCPFPQRLISLKKERGKKIFSMIYGKEE